MKQHSRVKRAILAIQGIQDMALERRNQSPKLADFLEGYMAGADHAERIVIEELVD